jgi:hypothetical protein
VRTRKEPVQPIPLFEELLVLLMKVNCKVEVEFLLMLFGQPENRHVTLNVGREVKDCVFMLKLSDRL